MNHFKKKNNKLERLRGIFFQIGFIIAAGLTFLAFEWMSPVNPYELPVTDVIYEDEWELPPIIPEEEVKKPEVKITETKKKSEIIEIVKNEPIEKKEEKKEEKKKELEFDPDKWKEVEKKEKDDAPVPIAEVMPEFDGLFEYLGKNLKYPARDRDAGIQGTVYVQFVVDKKGEIKNVKILRGVSRLIDKEAIRVVKSMPKWKPGKQRGRPVSVIFNLPINFKIKKG